MRLDAVIIFPGGDAVSVVGGPAGSRAISIREARAIDRFAAELGKNIPADVRVDDALELPEPTQHVLFVCRQAVLDRSSALQENRIHLLASRTVLVDVARGHELQLCEALALASAIGSDQYFHWQSDNNGKRSAEIMGLKSIGRELGATWATASALEGQHYALLRHPELRQLPTFLAAYLEAYVALL
jgi:hypothetical protein